MHQWAVSRWPLGRKRTDANSMQHIYAGVINKTLHALHACHTEAVLVSSYVESWSVAHVSMLRLLNAQHALSCSKEIGVFSAVATISMEQLIMYRDTHG